MGRLGVGKLRWGLMLLVAVAAGISGGTVSANGEGYETVTITQAPPVGQLGQALTTTGLPTGTCTPTANPPVVSGCIAVQADTGDTIVMHLLTPSGVDVSSLLSGDTSELVTGTDGIAYFGGLQVGALGYYELQAVSTNDEGSPPSQPTPAFLISSTLQPCSGSSCSGSASNSSSSLGVSLSSTPSGDFLSLALGGFTFTCPGYDAVSGALGVDVWASSTSGTGLDPTPLYEKVTITISKQLVDASPNNGAHFYQICYASTAPFAGGQDVGNLIPGYPDTYVGLLADCPKPSKHAAAGDAPCVLSRNKTAAGQVVISFLAAPGDFWGST